MKRDSQSRTQMMLYLHLLSMLPVFESFSNIKIVFVTGVIDVSHLRESKTSTNNSLTVP